VKWSVNQATYDSTIQLVNTIDSTWESVTPIPGLAEGSDVYFKVYAVGANQDTTETYKFHYETRPFCVSNGNMSWATGITLVDFGSISRASGKTQPYTDYRDTDSTTVSIGHDYDLSMNVNTDGNYTVHGRVWVDWNQDADYDDTGEEYDLGSATNTADSATSLSPLTITIPAGAGLGYTNMRVSARFGAPAGPCEEDFDGEVEDYRLIVAPFCYDSDSTLQVSACNSYLSPSGQIFTSSGTYFDTIPNLTGCDSTLTINLSIFHTLSSTSITTCNNYLSPTGNVYNVSGTYYDTLVAASGCDSIITTVLTVNTADNSVSQNGLTLTANATGANYQWVDCDNGFANIPGETNQDLIVTSNGNYAVIVTENGCADTSACTAITNVSTEEYSLANALRIFPNPTSGTFKVELGRITEDVKLEVRDVVGRLVHQEELKAIRQFEVDLSTQANAIYSLTVTVGHQRESILLIKE